MLFKKLFLLFQAYAVNSIGKNILKFACFKILVIPDLKENFERDEILPRQRRTEGGPVGLKVIWDNLIAATKTDKDKGKG